MAICFRIPYSDTFGSHLAFKWGDDAKEALSIVKKAHANAEFGVPEAVSPQPFTEASRVQRADFWQGQSSAAASCLPRSVVAVREHVAVPAPDGFLLDLGAAA